MSEMKTLPVHSNQSGPQKSVFQIVGWIFASFLLVAVFLAATLIMQSPIGTNISTFLTWLFSADSVQATWFITRAAGITSYLLIWLSVAWGLAVSNKILDSVLHRTFTYDFHQFISLLSIGFLVVHIGVLFFDHYLPYTVLQALVPFLSPYRPIWVGIGVIGFYLTILVTVTYYLRNRIGMKAFRIIHVFSLVAYLGATLHGFFSGTDSSLISLQIIYAGTFLVTIFLMIYWFFFLRIKKTKNNSQSASPSAKVLQPARPSVNAAYGTSISTMKRE